MSKIRVWKKDPRARLPERASKEAIGFDIFCLEETIVPPQEQVLVRTGLVIESSPPYALFIFPRSSLFRRKGLIFPHSVGVIDFDYCGAEDELRVPVLNLQERAVTISSGERIAQIVFLNVLTNPVLEEINSPPREGSRGGFGSTGGYR